jgi:uncharacterized repeat protein (TIGR04076 family)
MKTTRISETNNEQTFAGCGRRKFIASSLLGTAAVLGGSSLLNASNNSQTEPVAATKRHKCKITVLKRELYEDLQNEYYAEHSFGKCSSFQEGQEWIVDESNYWQMLNGQFCANAWDAISKFVYTSIQGGSMLKGMTKDEKVLITCCNNGTRPVIFKMERIDE